MFCPICDGKTRVVECRTPQWMEEHNRRGPTAQELQELGFDPVFVRWRQCKRCEWRFVTVEIPWKQDK